MIAPRRAELFGSSDQHSCNSVLPARSMSRLARGALMLLGWCLFFDSELSAQRGPAYGSVSGLVLADSTELPIAGAVLSVVGTNREVRSDATGRFLLASIPAGAIELRVRAIGFQMSTFSVTVRASVDLELDVMLSQSITTLDTAKVRARRDPLRPWKEDFDERRRIGIGHFIDSASLQKVVGESWVTLLLAQVPGLKRVRYSSRLALASTRGAISFQLTPDGDPVDRKLGAPKACYVKVIIDNIATYNSGVNEALFDITSIDAEAIAALEYYTVAQLPVQFNRGGSSPCGTLVIWTKN
jgi:hypothetical protein